ncbi:MAG: DedA family protein, partial [Akkermansiaceae bacterium]|nr:DedA family protein [Akkermansiaceae bacterium]
LSDLFLPIPGTVVMSALGYIYGLWLGGLFAALGSILAGLLAYGLCRLLGRGAAEWIAGKEDLAKGEEVFGGSAG